MTAARQITQFTCKQDMSRWTRAHAGAPGINWSVYPGPGGTMIVIEHEEDRSTFLAAQAAQTAQETQDEPADARYCEHSTPQSAQSTQGRSRATMDTVL